MELQAVHLRHLQIDNQAVRKTTGQCREEVTVPIRKSGHEMRANATTGSTP